MFNVEHWLFKKRTVFYITRSCFYRMANIVDSAPAFQSLIFSTAKELSAFPEWKTIGGGKAIQRLEQKGIFLAVVFFKHEIAGYYWGITGQDNQILWHDKFPIKPRQGLVFNAFVFPSYRRKGVYRLLQKRIHEHLFSKGCDVVYTIVENSNTPSMKANAEFGLKKFATNYLIKFFGKNIFSIYTNPEGIKVYYVGHGPQSHSF